MKISIVIITLFLAGCNPFSDFRPDSEKIVRAGWAETTSRPAPSPLYCYKTLGESMCHTMPLHDGDQRLSGSYEGYTPAPVQRKWWELSEFGENAN